MSRAGPTESHRAACRIEPLVFLSPMSVGALQEVPVQLLRQSEVGKKKAKIFLVFTKLNFQKTDQFPIYNICLWHLNIKLFEIKTNNTVVQGKPENRPVMLGMQKPRANTSPQDAFVYY